MNKITLDRYTLLGMLAILLWSITVAIARSLTEQLGPLTAAAAVSLVGGIISIPQMIRLPGINMSVKSGPGPPETVLATIKQVPKAYLFGCGSMFIIYMLSLFLAIGFSDTRTQVLEIGLINYLWPALTILFSLVILNKKANLLIIPGTCLALAGVFLVLTQGESVSIQSLKNNISTNPYVYFCALVAAVTWALYSNFSRKWSNPDSKGAVPLFMLVTGVFFLILRLIFQEESIWGFKVVVEIIIMGIATVIAYACWDIAMRKGDVILVASGSYFTPLLSTIVTCFYLQVAAGVNLWIGCLLIICGSLISWRAVTDQNGQDTYDD